MPIPGPRTQERPAPGYANPGMEQPHRINLWERPGAVADPGRSPGTMTVSLRGQRLAAGQIRRLWRQTVNYVAAQAAYSWTHNAPAPGRPVPEPGPFAITRALRYMTRSLYVRGGTDNTEFHGLHTKITPRVRSKPVTRQAGNKQNLPTIRNRLTSFGSRVPPLNPRSPAAKN